MQPGPGANVPGDIVALGFDPEGEGHDLLAGAVGREGVLNAVLAAFAGRGVVAVEDEAVAEDGT
jgi:hypothetical protein